MAIRQCVSSVTLSLRVSRLEFNCSHFQRWNHSDSAKAANDAECVQVRLPEEHKQQVCCWLATYGHCKAECHYCTHNDQHCLYRQCDSEHLERERGRKNIIVPLLLLLCQTLRGLEKHCWLHNHFIITLLLGRWQRIRRRCTWLTLPLYSLKLQWHSGEGTNSNINNLNTSIGICYDRYCNHDVNFSKNASTILYIVPSEFKLPHGGPLTWN